MAPKISTDARELVGRFIDAAVEDQAAARRMLRDHPDLLEVRWLHNETVLHFLAIEGFTAGVQFLLEMGANPNATNKFGDTALVDVASLGNVEIAELLLRHGADPDAQSTTRDNVLHTAAESGNAQLLDLLLSHGARVDYGPDIGETVWDAVRRTPKKTAELIAVLKKHGVPEEL